MSLEESCSLYLKFVVNHCEGVWNSTEPGSSILSLENIPSEVLKQLVVKIDALPGRKRLRLTVSQSGLRIRTLILDAPREVAMSELGALIIDAYQTSSPGVDWLLHLKLPGSARQHHAILHLSKEPDWSARPCIRGKNGVPSILMEVASEASESMQDLHRDKDEWFQFPEVLTVILVKIWSRRQTSPDSIELEVWTQTPNGPVIHTHWVHDADTVQQVPDLVLEASNVFQHDELPPHFTSVTEIRVSSIHLQQYVLSVLEEI
ncbi:hypothetical protein BT96DRAFT_912145 [Gymnopus androsaceus JB14]|uniref:Uncharacterized protein n=1 Tax=Gymnopus androsaceus JB14 TaxID=1447944 RepID=A0A6A4ILW8_9AGAR|nr:hypothetical protein BT96DRAFT_912145 [Gymnopus androsaceus JB14]